jgi:hypothetical protein
MFKYVLSDVGVETANSRQMRQFPISISASAFAELETGLSR